MRNFIYLLCLLLVCGCSTLERQEPAKPPLSFPKVSILGRYCVIDSQSSNIHIRADFVYVEDSRNMFITNNLVWVVSNQVRKVSLSVFSTLYLNNPLIPQANKEEYRTLFNRNK